MCIVAKDSQLNELPPVGLLLHDIFVLAGGCDFLNMHGPALGTMQTPFPNELLPSELRHKNLSYERGYTYFATEAVLSWLKEAEPFIEDGRLIYLPRSFILTILPQGVNREEAHWDAVIPEVMNRAYELRAQKDGTLLAPDVTPGFPWRSVQETCSCMPFLKGLPL